jgi:hypothetical protein
MAEVKYDRNHHSGGTPEARLANRYRNSGDTKTADHVTKHGSSPSRTYENIHERGQGGGERRVDVNDSTSGRVASHPASKSQGGGSVG